MLRRDVTATLVCVMLTLLANVPTSQSEDSQQCSWSDQECPGKLWYWSEYNLEFLVHCRHIQPCGPFGTNSVQPLVHVKNVCEKALWYNMSGWKQWWLYGSYQSTTECQQGFPCTKYLTVGVVPFWEKGNILLKCYNFIGWTSSIQGPVESQFTLLVRVFGHIVVVHWGYMPLGFVVCTLNSALLPH